MRELEREAYQQILAGAKGWDGPEFSRPIFGQIAAMWADWKRGIPPSREWRGRGAQNPRLLAAFAALDRAEARARRDMETRR